MRYPLCAFFLGAVTYMLALPVAADTPEVFIGKWGMAAYWKAEDAEKARKWAKEACSQPYIIARGTTANTVMMHIADNPEVQPVKIVIKGKRTELVPVSDGVAGGVARHTRQLANLYDNGFALKWMDDDVASRYGTNVYYRCR